MKLTEIVVIIAIVLILIVTVVTGIEEYKHDSKVYNNGKCYYCEIGNWELICVYTTKNGDSTTTHWVYKCTNCHETLDTTINFKFY